MKLLPSVLSLGILFSLHSLHAQTTIYRETFGSTVNSAPLSGVGWTALNGATGTTPAATSLGLSSLTGRPTDLDNVNAGVSASSSQGFVFAVGPGAFTSNSFVFTNEFTIDRSQFEPSAFSIYSGNTNPSAGNGYRFVVQIEGSWYATDSVFVNSTNVPTAGDFASTAEQVSFTFTTTASAWRLLTVNPGVELSLAATTLASDLPGGNITGFGVYSLKTGTDVRRFDTFEVTAVPEPSTVAMLGLAGVILVGALRRARLA